MNGLLMWIVVLVLAVFSTVLDPGEPTCTAGASGCDGDFVWRTVTIDGVEGVIVPERAVPDLTSWGSEGPIEGVWSPDKADIVALESRIEEAAGVGSSPSAESRPASLDGYVRQYGGIIEGGEKKIFVNGMCHVDGDDWTHSVYIVMDGGTCFFQAVYNVETGEFERFQYNGDA